MQSNLLKRMSAQNLESSVEASGQFQFLVQDRHQVYRLFTDIWWPSAFRRPWDKRHDDFALLLEECLLSDPRGAPEPYEVEVE